MRSKIDDKLRQKVDEMVLGDQRTRHLSRDSKGFIVEAGIPIPDRDEGLIIMRNEDKWLIEDRHYTYRDRDKKNSYVEAFLYEVDISDIKKIQLDEDVDVDEYNQAFSEQHLNGESFGLNKSDLEDPDDGLSVKSQYENLGELAKDIYKVLENSPETVDSFSSYLKDFFRD